MSNLSDDLATHAADLAEDASEAVTITWNGNSVTVDAVPARTRLDLETVADVSIQNEMKDFILTAADLVLNSRVTRPQPGMRIAVTLGGAAAVFEVANIPGGQCYSWMDHAETLMRIHAVKVR